MPRDSDGQRNIQWQAKLERCLSKESKTVRSCFGVPCLSCCIESKAPLQPNSCLLEVPQVLKHAIAGQEVLRRVELHDDSVLEHQHLVELGDGLEPMRHDDDGPVAKLGLDELVDESFRLTVETSTQDALVTTQEAQQGVRGI